MVRKGEKMREETKRKISLSRLGPKHHYYGKHLSEEHKQKIADALKGVTHGFKKGCKSLMEGKKHSEETKKKISDAKRGKPCSSSTKFKEGHKPWNTGKKRSFEFVQNMKERIAKLDNFSGFKGTDKHKKLVSKTASLLKEHANSVEIEKRVIMNDGSWRIIDVLVNKNICYEIGTCKKSKVKDLLDNGFEVVHLPYNMLEGWL